MIGMLNFLLRNPDFTVAFADRPEALPLRPSSSEPYAMWRSGLFRPETACAARQPTGVYSVDRIPCRQADGVTPIVLLNERLNAASDS